MNNSMKIIYYIETIYNVQICIKMDRFFLTYDAFIRIMKKPIDIDGCGGTYWISYVYLAIILFCWSNEVA